MVEDDTQKAEELLQSSTDQKRHNTDPIADDDDVEDGTNLKDAIRNAYEQIDSGDRHTNLSIRDDDLAALIYGLEEAGNLDDVATDAQKELGRDVDEEIDGRGPLLEVLVKYALVEVAGDTVDTSLDARREWLSSQADDF